MSQQEAVGVIETLGFPSILAAADAMVKAGRVTIVFFDKAEKGNFIVVIRGGISEVKPAMEAGLAAAEKTMGGQVMTHYTVPNPPDNVVAVLPIEYTEAVERYRS
jgi:microcompartment protein CcmL/EutN